MCSSPRRQHRNQPTIHLVEKLFCNTLQFQCNILYTFVYIHVQLILVFSGNSTITNYPSFFKSPSCLSPNPKYTSKIISWTPNNVFSNSVFVISDKCEQIQFFTMKSNVMPLYKFPVFAGKQDVLREVVMKYIDHFYPK